MEINKEYMVELFFFFIIVRAMPILFREIKIFLGKQ